MNRGLQFFTPTANEWFEYNARVLEKQMAPLEANAGGDSSSGVYMLTNTMPAFVLNLTRPNLNWCVDSGLLTRHETKINVGSSYFVTDRCVLGPRVCCWEASVDERATAYMESFAKEVSNGLRWILQIYGTTNIIQQHDLFNMDLAVARNMRNKLAFANYTPVRLVAPLRDGTDCEDVPIVNATGESPFFVQPYGFGSCTSAPPPIGSDGQLTRPYLGTAAVTGFCSNADMNSLAVRDPYVLNADDRRQLFELIRKNREEIMNNSYGVFRPSSSGLSDRRNDDDAGGGGGGASTNAPPPRFFDPPSTSQPAVPIPENGTMIRTPPPPNVGENYTDVHMDDTLRQFVGS